jgi:uncharacterized membrane protein
MSRSGSNARALGWFSLGLGLPQIVAPGAVNALIGVEDDARSRAWQRIVGVREIAAGVGILSSSRPVGWVGGRVAGDAMDLALLGTAFEAKRARKERLAGAIGAVVAIAIADATETVRLSRRPQPQESEQRKHAKAAVTVHRPRDEVYAAWHDFRALPRFMTHVESVEQRPGGRTHWKATGPAGRTVEWDAEVVEDRPGELIAWRSVGGYAQHAGSVRFVPAPGDRGTEIHLDLAYSPPGGAVGSTIARLFGEEPEQQIEDDLRRFKQLLETGVIVRSEGSPEGPRTSRLLRQRPAQPLPAGAGDDREGSHA